MRLHSILAISLAALAASFLGTSSSVGRMSLDELVRRSDIVAVCRVTRVERVRVAHEETDPIPEPESRGSNDWLYPGADMTFAEAEVVELLKGERSLKRVHFLAQRTWTCDTSEAVTGETALFFFNSLALPEPSRPRFLRSMLEFTSDSPAYRIAHSGRGRMPLRVVDGDPYATYWTEVVMPQDLPNIDGPEPEYVGFIRSAPLPLLVSKIKECTTAHGAMLRAREWRKGHDDWSWSISVWRDGRYVMEYKTLDDRKAEIAAKAPLWSCLDSDQFLAWPAAEIGTAGLDGGVELEVLAGNQLRTVRFPAPEKWNAAEFKAFEAPLRTLLEVLDSMELPKTADLRERYHAVLAKSR